MRALASLGVVHEPDFTQEMIDALEEDGISVDTIVQLSRSAMSGNALEQYGAALTIALFKPEVREKLEVWLVHAARNFSREQRHEFMMHLYQRGMERENAGQTGQELEDVPQAATKRALENERSKDYEFQNSSP